MKILVFSDTHGRTDKMYETLLAVKMGIPVLAEFFPKEIRGACNSLRRLLQRP